MGHCISYPLICDIETGYAKVAQQKSAQSLKSAQLPMQPKENEMVLTVFWADNFDIIETENTSVEYIHVSVPKTKSWKINVSEVPVAIRFVDAKKEPPQFNNQHEPSLTYDTRSYTTNYLLWVILRKQNALDQLIPIYSGWKLQTRRKGTGTAVIKTTECYLPPILSKVTDYETIYNTWNISKLLQVKLVCHM